MVLNVYSWRPDYSTCSADTGGRLRGFTSGSAACLVRSAYHIIRVANWRSFVSAREKLRKGSWICLVSFLALS